MVGGDIGRASAAGEEIAASGIPFEAAAARLKAGRRTMLFGAELKMTVD